MKWRTWSRPAAALVSVVALGLGISGAGPVASAAGSVPVSVSLSKPVVAAACSGSPVVCSVGVAEGATGFPVSVSTTGITGGPGTAPVGDWVQVSVSGYTFNGGWVDGDGAFGNIWLAGLAPGQVATVSWTAPESVTVTTAGQVASAIRAAGLPAGDYTLAADVTPWAAALGGTNTGEFTSLSGSYAGTGSDTATVNITSAQTGTSGDTISVTDGGQTTSYTNTSGTAGQYTVTLGGSTFTLNVASATATSGQSFTLTLNPTSTAFTLTDATSDAGNSLMVTGPLPANVQNGLVTMGNGAVVFDVGSTVVSDETASYTQTGTTPSVITEQPAVTDFQVG